MAQRARFPLLLVVLALLAGLLTPAAAPAQTVAAPACPATFDVLHDDKIDGLRLPAGPYTLTPLSTRLSCAAASDLFRQFLEDWDGVLPRPWRLDVPTRTFRRGSGGVGFTVARASSPSGGGGGGHYPHGTACPGTFRVLQRDHIGTFVVPAGVYQITLLSVGRITCRQAAADLEQFLEDFDGILPSPWLLDPETAAFMRGSRNVGFRIKEKVGPPTPSGGGGGTTTGRCPGTFQVLHNDHVGRLRLPKGRYWITIPKGSRVSCRSASNLFRRFLDDVSGVLSPPWVVNSRNGTFTRGRASRTAFRVKPARRVASATSVSRSPSSSR
jgi:hypothetical protein